jgi:threonyl-tRNA synthetase
MHADFIEYQPIKKEIAGAEPAEKKLFRENDVVVLFTAVETGDDEATGRKAIDDAKDFLSKLGAKKVMVYPFAHLSQNLAGPQEALKVLKAMEDEAKVKDLRVSRAPFGWNKALQIKVKGHPLAEMSRSYGGGAVKEAPKPVKPRRELSEEEALSRLKKSDFGNLPETDHRIIGEKLGLFSFQEVSPGMVYLHRKGLVLRNILVDFLRREYAKGGYQEVATPSLANTALWQVSGHSAHYKDNMFLTTLGDEEMGMKPMNCPSHFLIYKTRKWSFRELPVRYATFDPLYRNELSGVASGLFRVKVLSQDDAHIIAMEEQAEEELGKMLDLMEKVYKVFGLQYRVKISTRPDDSMGTDEEWKRATDTLVRVVEARGWKYEIKEKEGNFYSPKIDVDIRDSLGREWQCGTFQYDIQMPKRFSLTYTGSDGKEHTPVVLHRTILGSLERFMGVMLEHYRGVLPIWLSPVQARVVPLSDEHLPYAREVLEAISNGGVRVEGDFAQGTLGSKVRDAQLQKVPYVVVVGGKEEENETIAVRTRDGKNRLGVKVADFVAEVAQKASNFE